MGIFDKIRQRQNRGWNESVNDMTDGVKRKLLSIIESGLEAEKVIEHIKTYAGAPRGVWYPNVHYESVDENGKVRSLQYYSKAIGEPLVLRKMDGKWKLKQ